MSNWGLPPCFWRFCVPRRYKIIQKWLEVKGKVIFFGSTADLVGDAVNRGWEIGVYRCVDDCLNHDLPD